MAIERKKGQRALTLRQQRRARGRVNARKASNRGHWQRQNEMRRGGDAAMKRAFKGVVGRWGQSQHARRPTTGRRTP